MGFGTGIRLLCDDHVTTTVQKLPTGEESPGAKPDGLGEDSEIESGTAAAPTETEINLTNNIPTATE